MALDDARAKLQRAEVHAYAFDSALRGLLDSDNQPTVGQFDPHTRQYTVRLSIPERHLDELGLLLGDCLFNLRCSLDHAIYGLAIAHSEQNPPPDEERIEFPIFMDAAKFKSRGKAKIGTLRASTQTLIEEWQPFQPGNGGTQNTLWVLHELNRRDKHRRLHPVAARLGEQIVLGATEPPDQPIELTAITPPGPLENNATLLSFIIRGNEPKVALSVDVGLEMVISGAAEIDSSLPTAPLLKLVPLLVARVTEVVRGLETHV